MIGPPRIKTLSPPGSADPTFSRSCDGLASTGRPRIGWRACVRSATEAPSKSALTDDARPIRADIAAWPAPPLISVIMPVYNTDLRWLGAAKLALRNQ
jgi:hypothetical protein